jgi:hypothetical protein
MKQKGQKHKMQTIEKKSTTTSVNNGVKIYPTQFYHRLLMGYANYHDMSKSEAGCDMVKKFFDGLPDSEKQKFLNHSKNSY